MMIFYEAKHTSINDLAHNSPVHKVSYHFVETLNSVD